jgi:hypothetical protein
MPRLQILVGSDWAVIIFIVKRASSGARKVGRIPLCVRNAVAVFRAFVTL